MAGIDPKLGSKVSTRTINWNDEVIKAWGSEFRTPDHKIYQFSGGNDKDSTDKGKTGIYGVVGDNSIILSNQYPDMRDGLNMDFGVPNGSLNQPFGSFDELVTETLATGATSSSGNVVETDPYFSFVNILVHPDGPTIIDRSSFARTFDINTAVVSTAQTTLGNPTSVFKAVSDTTVVLRTATNANLACAANEPCTIEFSIFLLSLPASQYNVGFCKNYTFAVTAGGAISANAGNTVGMGTIQAGRWYQVALTYDGDIERGYLNGVVQSQSGQGITRAAITGTPQWSFMSTINPGQNSIAGYISEYRYTKGFARYGANYTPRTTPFPNQ